MAKILCNYFGLSMDAEGKSDFVGRQAAAFLGYVQQDAERCAANCGSAEDLSAAPEEIKREILRNDEELRRREQTAPGVEHDVVAIYDNAGIPSIMHRFRRVTNKELFGGSDAVHPAFIIGGEVYDEIYISVYENTMINGKPYSLPLQEPVTNITMEDFAQACFSKGEGWHCLTAAEWGLLADTGLKLGTMPHGNTNCSHWHGDDKEQGIIIEDSYKTLTGSSPATWTHDHTASGVHDLCGNIWEFARGVRIRDGALWAAENNDAALPETDLTECGDGWKPITDAEGHPLYVAVEDNKITFKTYIQDLSTDIPRTTDQLTAMSAALGQSGIGVDQQLTTGYLRDTAVTATAMDLDDQTAGNYVAKWEASFNFDHKQVMTLLDQINYLGAHNATTAGEIAQSVNSAASMGQIAGVDPAATAAMATAMQATGVATDRVGTSISRIYTNLSKGSNATKAQKEMWEELGFTAEGIAKSMQTDGVGTLKEVFTALQDMPDERKVAALSTLFGQDAPTTLQVGGVSKPSDTDFSELERETIWKNTSIKRIGESIAGRYGLGFTYDADDYDIECDEQDGTDSSYYNTLCKNYGLILKVYAKRLWVYDRERYKGKRAVQDFDRTNIIPGSLSYNTTLSGTYTGGYFTYTDADKDLDIVCSVGGGNHTKNVNRRATSVFDASVQLCAEINNANHGRVKLKFSVMGNWGVSAGNNLRLTGYGDGLNGGINGKYFVDKVTHKYTKSGGFVTSFECSGIFDPFHYWDVGGHIEYHQSEDSSSESYNSAYETTSPAANAASAAAGAAVTLTKAPFYYTSVAPKPSCYKSGTFYFYDGILVNNRYRITNTAARCGKLPVGKNVTGWVPASYCNGGGITTK